MTASKSLPDRPSLDSLRKQAKKLARDTAAGDATAIARARVHLPQVEVPLTRRNAQLVIAREYGYAGWPDLAAEVSKRLGKSLEWAVTQARRALHDNDIERLKQLLFEYPELLSWKGGHNNGLLGMATTAYGDAGDPERERWFTRAASAELLIDAGAIVDPSVSEDLLRSRARGLLQLFQRKDLLPRTLKFAAALGDLNAVRTTLDKDGDDPAGVNEAFFCACSFDREQVALYLLERSITLDPELGKRIDGSLGRRAFVKSLINQAGLDLAQAKSVGPWNAFVMGQVLHAVHHGDLTSFVGELQREPWLMDEAFVWFQVEIIESATLNDQEEFINTLLDLDPPLLRRRPPPPSQAIEFAFTYAHTHLLTLLTRIWPVPDDLPHAAGLGNLSRVKQWFDESGAPDLGHLEDHYPGNDPRARGHLHWDSPTTQQVLDTALAFSVINQHFDVADFLLEHGADINTGWNSHEPASILHHLVFYGSYESMQFLVARGIDMTIKDYRWNSTAQGWARYAKKDLEMAEWLADAERRRERR